MIIFQKEIFLILFSVSLNILAQYLIKYSTSINGPINGNFSDIIRGLYNIIATPTCLLGLFSAFIAAMFYILALSKLPLSIAYPFTALGFVLVVSIGIIFFNEPLSIAKIIGVTLIIIGIGFILQT
jgi:multidrug transporter EmrE-like cation transporter